MWATGETIFRQPPGPVRGTVTLSEQPGLGLEPVEDVLRESRED
jgi:L-alanine-DL-glutamate epimerase-like enolase superfamily enzyme